MSGNFTRKMYDGCAYRQNVKQSTDPLGLILDVNKYINKNNICQPTLNNPEGVASLVDVESSLMGIDKLESDCDNTKYPFCRSTGCLLTNDSRVIPHMTPYACEWGKFGDNAVITTNMSMPSDTGFDIQDMPVCSTTNGYYYDKSKCLQRNMQHNRNINNQMIKNLPDDPMYTRFSINQRGGNNILATPQDSQSFFDQNINNYINNLSPNKPNGYDIQGISDDQMQNMASVQNITPIQNMTSIQNMATSILPKCLIDKEKISGLEVDLMNGVMQGVIQGAQLRIQSGKEHIKNMQIIINSLRNKIQTEKQNYQQLITAIRTYINNIIQKIDALRLPQLIYNSRTGYRNSDNFYSNGYDDIVELSQYIISNQDFSTIIQKCIEKLQSINVLVQNIKSIVEQCKQYLQKYEGYIPNIELKLQQFDTMISNIKRVTQGIQMNGQFLNKYSNELQNIKNELAQNNNLQLPLLIGNNYSLENVINYAQNVKILTDKIKNLLPKIKNFENIYLGTIQQIQNYIQQFNEYIQDHAADLQTLENAASMDNIKQHLLASC